MDTVIKDLLGQPVAVGDKVVISVTGYRDLTTATVTKLTPKGIQAAYRNPRYPEDSQWGVDKTQRSLGMFVKVAA